MNTIKETVQKTVNDMKTFETELIKQGFRSTTLLNKKKEYYNQVYYPALLELQKECESKGHVNNEEKITLDGVRYYSCDNCKKNIAL